MKFNQSEIRINPHERCSTPRTLVHQASNYKFAGQESLETFADRVNMCQYVSGGYQCPQHCSRWTAGKALMSSGV